MSKRTIRRLPDSLISYDYLFDATTSHTTANTLTNLSDQSRTAHTPSPQKLYPQKFYKDIRSQIRNGDVLMYCGK